MANDHERYERFVDPIDGAQWEVDVDFLASNWRCIWGAGCEGILDDPAAELGQGCCSVGAQMLDAEESRRIGALGATLDPERFQFHREAAEGGVFADVARAETRIVDDACIFLNRPGFAGGAGCALHLAAEADGERPMDWKPSVCWQLPLKVEVLEQADAAPGTDPGVTAEPARRLRRWTRADWGSGGETMAWCCTERPRAPEGDGAAVGAAVGAAALDAAVGATGLDTAVDATVLDATVLDATALDTTAYVGHGPAADYLAEELEALVGTEVAVAISRRVGRRSR